MWMPRLLAYLARLGIPLKFTGDFFSLFKDSSGLPTNMGIWVLLLAVFLLLLGALAVIVLEVKMYLNGLSSLNAHRELPGFRSIFGVRPTCAFCHRFYRFHNFRFWRGTVIKYLPCNCAVHVQCLINRMDEGDPEIDIEVEEDIPPQFACLNCGQQSGNIFADEPAAVNEAAGPNIRPIWPWEEVLVHWWIPLLAAFVYAVFLLLAPDAYVPPEINQLTISPFGGPQSAGCRINITMLPDGDTVTFINATCAEGSTFYFNKTSFHRGIPSVDDPRIPSEDEDDFCTLFPRVFKGLPILRDMWIYISNLMTRDEIEAMTKEIHFYVWNRRDSAYVKIDMEALDTLEDTWDKTLPLKLINHGFAPGMFRGKSLEYLFQSGMISMAEQYVDKFNVVLVDWTVFSAGLDYFTSATRTWYAGKTEAAFLEELQFRQLIRYEEVHIIGFSLGAHVAGVAGYFIQLWGGIISRITALDAARPCFIVNGKPYHDLRRVVDASDATFVDEIHCDDGNLGTDAILGHVTFFPNGGKRQPGCIELFDIGCSHNQCTMMFSKSLENGETACPCPTWEAFLQRKCECEQGNGFGNRMGEHCRYNAVGKYYLNTTSGVGA